MRAQSHQGVSKQVIDTQIHILAMTYRHVAVLKAFPTKTRSILFAKGHIEAFVRAERLNL